jgi:hypothetical protein
MRFTNAIACLIVALDCAEKAMGEQPQQLIAPNYLWTWWIVAGGWLLCTAANLVRR